MYDLYQEESLEHFGIKGMKWGIRRTPEQLGHKTTKKQKKQRTPEEIARSQKRKETAIKVAKTGVKIAAGVATTAVLGKGIGRATEDIWRPAAEKLYWDYVLDHLPTYDYPLRSMRRTIKQMDPGAITAGLNAIDNLRRDYYMNRPIPK